MTKNHVICIAATLAVAGAAATAAVPVSRIAETHGFRSAQAAPVSLAPRPMRAAVRPAGDARASFTVETPAAHVAVVSENFDAALPSGWSVDAAQYAKWTLKQIAAPGDAKSFSAIDPADVKSLYVEGDYRVYNREASSATTCPMAVPQLGSLQAYVGFSQNMDYVCRLVISVSTDDFATDGTEIWNSKDETGDKTWRWHPINVSLAQWAGQTVRLRFTYTWGSDDEIFKKGGYLGDFAIDGLTISGLAEITGISVMTGEEVQLIDITDYAGTEARSWQWSFPGGVPETSAEASPTVYYTADGDYDVTLTTVDAAGVTRTATSAAYVHITGTEPVAHILPPATFKYDGTDAYMVAPLVPVTFTDASTGFPSSQTWTFMGHSFGDPNAVMTAEGPTAQVAYGYQHIWPVGLEVANIHGSSADLASVSAEYEGFFSNMPAEPVATNFDMEDWGLFPGSNTIKITAFAEKFSAPSRPMVLDGAYVYFTQAQADELYYQIQTITVRVYTAGADGKPDRQLDFGLCDVIDLNAGSTDGSVIPTAFEFSDRPVVSGDFFIVVDGIPEYCETCCVAFGMTPFGAEGGTAWMLKDGKWMEVSSYFPAGSNHTSFCIKPYGTHSVMASLNDDGSTTVEIGPEGGTREYTFFSYLGYKDDPEIDADWLSIVSPHGDMTVETLTLSAEPIPAGVDERTATVRLTDGMSTLEVPVVQKGMVGLQTVEATAATAGTPAYYTLQGVPVATPAPGAVYIRVSADGRASKVMLR